VALRRLTGIEQETPVEPSSRSWRPIAPLGEATALVGEAKRAAATGRARGRVRPPARVATPRPRAAGAGRGGRGADYGDRTRRSSRARTAGRVPGRRGGRRVDAVRRGRVKAEVRRRREPRAAEHGSRSSTRRSRPTCASAAATSKQPGRPCLHRRGGPAPPPRRTASSGTGTRQASPPARGCSTRRWSSCRPSRAHARARAGQARRGPARAALGVSERSRES